jgi:hypothetical protein
MNHIAAIQNEFLKEARKWNDLSLQEQRLYLKRHPGSKRRLTARPKSQVKGEESLRTLKTVKGIRQLFRTVKTLDRLSTVAEKAGVNIKRHKVYWKIERAINEGRMPSGTDPYNLSSSWSRNPKKDRIVTKRLNKLVHKISDTTDDVLDSYVQGVRKYSEPKKQLKEDILKHIKINYLVERKIKVPNKVKDLKKELKPKVKKVKRPDWASTGDRVRLSNGVVITISNIKRGHKWTTIYGNTDDGSHWHSKQRGSSYDSMNVKFLGKASKKDTEKHVKHQRDFDRTIQDDASRDRQQGLDKIRDLNIQPGDRILIKGGSYNWPATVMSIDYRQGGVRIDQQRQRHQHRSIFGISTGPVTTHYRFIAGKFIVGKSKN